MQSVNITLVLKTTHGAINYSFEGSKRVTKEVCDTNESLSNK